MADLLLPAQPDSASDITVSQGKFRKQIASAVAAIRGAMGAGDFSPDAGLELAQRVLTSQYVLYVDPTIGRDTVRLGVANAAVNPPLLNQQLECGYSPFAPFKSLARALLEAARISVVPGINNDVYDRVVISVANGEHMAENHASALLPPVRAFQDGQAPTADELAAFNSSSTPGLILPRGVSVLGMDLRKTVVRPSYVPPPGGNPSTSRGAIFRTTGGGFFFTFTFKDNPSFAQSHHLLSCFTFCDDADLKAYYDKVRLAFGIATPAEVMPGETEIVAPYPNTPTPAVDSTIGSSCYVFSCSIRSNYGLTGMFLDGGAVTGLKSMVTAQFTQVSLQRDMNAWQVYKAGAWVTVADYDEYIASDINDLRARVDGDYDPATGCYTTDWRGFGFKCIREAFLQEVSCFVIGHTVHHWTASGGEVTITNSNSNFGMTALLSSGFRGINTGGGAFPQDQNFDGVAVKRPLQIKQDGTNIRQLAIGFCSGYDATAGEIQLDVPLDPSVLSGYSLRPGTYIWIANSSRESGPGFVPGDLQTSTAVPVRAVLAAVPWDPNRPTIIKVTPSSSNIQTVDPLELVGNRVYLRRLIDTRQPEEREVAVIVQTTANSRRPLGNYVVRLSNKNTRADQLDPSNGANQIFLVTSSDLATIPGVIATVPTYKLVLRPGDSVTTTISSQTYHQIGEPVFTQARIQRAKKAGALGAFDSSKFEPSYSMLPDGRGIEFGRVAIGPRIIIDTDTSADPVSTTLGVNLDTNVLVTQQMQSAVDYVAVSQFMLAVGYAQSDVKAILTPQLTENQRYWRPDDSNAAVPAGKISGRGVWQLEFNRPSIVRAFGHAYEWAGQGNYSKALPKYQVWVLSDQHKVDFFGVSHMGGRVYNTGFNEDGLLIQGNTIRDLASNRDLNTEVAGIGGLAGDSDVLKEFPTEFEDLTVTRNFSSNGKAVFNEVTFNGVIEGNPIWRAGALPIASTTQAGVLRLATDDEARAFVVDDAAISPATLLEALGDAVKGVVNLRLSASQNSPFQNQDIQTSALYIHPYQGSEISLYSSTLRRWSIQRFDGVMAFSLAPANLANTVYDVYIANRGTPRAPDFQLDYVAWPTPQSEPQRTVKDGVLCKLNSLDFRLIGTVRTESPQSTVVRLGGTIPGSLSSSYPLIGVSNLYNPFSVSMRYFFGNSWTEENSGWGPPPARLYPVAPRCAFVLPKPTLVTAFLDLYYNKNSTNGSIAYVAPGIDSVSGPPDDAFYGEVSLPGMPGPGCATPNSQWARTLNPGLRQIYYLHRCFNGGNIINEHLGHGLIVTTAL